MSDESKELETRLAAARERRRAAEAKREQTASALSTQAMVEAEERDAADAEAIAKAEEEIGERRIAVIRTELGAVIVKRPNPVLYKRFRDKESAKTQDLEMLVRPCLVHPPFARFDAMLEEQPAVLDRVADRVVFLAGFRGKEVSEK